MTFQKKIQGTIAALIVASSMVTAAYATGVACPTVADVKGADRALNTVMRQSQKNFFVLTAQPAINASDLGWLVLTQTSASGFDAAFTSGQNDVKSVTMAAMETAMEQQGVYICAYFTGSGGMNVMALAPQQQGLTFNPAVLNLQNLKIKK